MSAHAVFYKKLQSKTNAFYLLFFLCVGMVVANIIASQGYNKTMYGVMERDEASTLTYLRHIWGSPLYELEIETLNNERRISVLNAWMKVQNENKQRIQNLEKSSILYPYSPEIHYNLSLLYRESGDASRSLEHLKRAQQIDPSIK